MQRDPQLPLTRTSERGRVSAPRGTSAGAGVAVLLLVVCWAPAGFAMDGAREINQSCAEGAGCFPGDGAGFPVTIATSGSYRLTSNLVVTDSALDALRAAADGISIDLAGFEIAGPVTCTGTGGEVSCGGGSGSGIAASARARVRISNGRVRGFGLLGVSVGRHGQVLGVIATANGSNGIQAAGSASIVSNCILQKMVVTSTPGLSGGDPSSSMIQFKIEATVAAPIVVDGEIVAILYQDRRDAATPFSPEDVKLFGRTARIFQEFPDLTLGML